MEIKRKKLFTAVLALAMIGMFAAIYFVVSAASFPPKIESADNFAYTIGTNETFPLVASEINPASSTNLASFTNIPATSTNLKWHLADDPSDASKKVPTWVTINASDPNNVKLVVDDTWARPGTYEFWIIATNSEGSAMQLFKLTVKPSIPTVGPGGSGGGGDSSGGSSAGGTAYNIKVNVGEGGKASSDWNAAFAGAQITITVRPDSGYVVKSVAVTEDNGAVVPVTQNSGTRYSFIMPASNVTVTVTFEKEADGPDGPGDEHDCPSEPYEDLDITQWYHEFTDYVIANKLMTGTSTSPLLFEPYTRLSRAMMVQILYNMEDRPAVGGGTQIFDDVAVGSWYFDAIAWAYEYEVVFGYDNGNFGPNDDVTREQMVAILYRYSQYKGYDTSARAELDGFEDAGDVSEWAVEAMKWAVGAGLIIGRSDEANIIVPLDTATRVEVATIITRFCQKIVGTEMPVPEVEEEEDEEEAEEDEDEDEDEDMDEEDEEETDEDENDDEDDEDDNDNEDDEDDEEDDDGESAVG